MVPKKERTWGGKFQEAKRRSSAVGPLWGWAALMTWLPSVAV